MTLFNGHSLTNNHKEEGRRIDWWKIITHVCQVEKTIQFAVLLQTAVSILLFYICTVATHFKSALLNTNEKTSDMTSNSNVLMVDFSKQLII